MASTATRSDQMQAAPFQNTMNSMDDGARYDLPLDERPEDDPVEPFASEDEALAFIDHFATKALAETW